MSKNAGTDVLSLLIPLSFHLFSTLMSVSLLTSTFSLSLLFLSSLSLLTSMTMTVITGSESSLSLSLP